MLDVRCWVSSLLCLLLLCAGRAVFAHDPGLSSATVRLFPDKLEAQLTFALRDADELARLDSNNDGTVSAEEFTASEERLGKLVATAFEVRFDDSLTNATEIRCQFDENNNNADVFLVVPGKKFSRLAIRSKMIAGFRLDHRQYFLLQNPSGVVMAERLLSANSDTVTIEVEAPPPALAADPATNAPMVAAATPKPAKSESSFNQFLLLGIEHILKGYDHLLFLLALLIVSRDWLSSVKIITFFTIAHSITLAVATLNLVRVPGRFVEPLIAVSIVYVGVENILRRGDPHGRWLLTFAFGLVHGFGFASVLRDMGVASRQGGVAMPLFSFNLGVELGQIIVAAVALPVIWHLRKQDYFLRRAVPACSVLVAIAGGIWFVQRVWL
jgi:hydrogenase/urease accessory protein HupE